MKVETKEERLQRILREQYAADMAKLGANIDDLDFGKDIFNKDDISKDDVDKDDIDKDMIDKDDKDDKKDDKDDQNDPNLNNIIVDFVQDKTAGNNANEVMLNGTLTYQVNISGIDLRLAEWQTSPKGIIVFPNNKDVFVSIIDDSKTEISVIGNRAGTASLNLILKDENDQTLSYSTSIQIEVKEGKTTKKDCVAENCEMGNESLTLRSESMQWPSKWEDVSKYFLTHLRNSLGKDSANSIVDLKFVPEKSTVTVAPTILESENDDDGKTRTNKYGNATFKVRFKQTKPGEIAVFYAQALDPDDPSKYVDSKLFYVEMTDEKLPAPRVPNNLNGVLSYSSDYCCINANLILGQDINEGTQIGFYFNDKLNMLPCTNQSAVPVKLDPQALTNGVHHICYFTVDIFDNPKFSHRERIIIDDSLTGDCDKKIENILPKPNISVTIPQACYRYFNSVNTHFMPTLCLKVKNRVAQMDVEKLIIIFNGYSRQNACNRDLVYRSTMEIYADDPKVSDLFKGIAPDDTISNVIELDDPTLSHILTDALPNIEVGYLGIQVMVFEKNGNCYLCNENLYTVFLPYE